MIEAIVEMLDAVVILLILGIAFYVYETKINKAKVLTQIQKELYLHRASNTFLWFLVVIYIALPSLSNTMINAKIAITFTLIPLYGVYCIWKYMGIMEGKK